MPTTGKLWLPRRAVLAGGAASLALIRPAWAEPPATIASGKTIGRGQMLVVSEDGSGRIVALDSSSYLGPHKTHPNDVIVVGSYCGTRILAPMFTRGVKAVIATDAGIGKDNAGISGLLHGETIGVPVATIAAMSAETSNGRETLLLGRISRANKQAQALGVEIGMIAYEAAARLAKAPPGKSIPTPLGNEETPKVVDTVGNGRVWASPGTTAITEKIPNDVVCSGANSSRVSSDGVLRMGAKGSIANDAGIARNNTAVEGVALLEEKGIPSAAVATLSARLGEGFSTWNDGVISVLNAPAAKRGVKVGMPAKEAARLMLA
ncbi:MAG: hypothetical protein K2Y71_12285 [Xanthobacteraceae bacterium]|nr:hypothetical protein [Xanthobacteraceae bacterium]